MESITGTTGGLHTFSQRDKIYCASLFMFLLSVVFLVVTFAVSTTSIVSKIIIIIIATVLVLGSISGCVYNCCCNKYIDVNDLPESVREDLGLNEDV